MLDFIVKMFAWKAEWEVKKEYDKEFGDLSSMRSILRFIILLIILSILIKFHVILLSKGGAKPPYRALVYTFLFMTYLLQKRDTVLLLFHERKVRVSLQPI